MMKKKHERFSSKNKIIIILIFLFIKVPTTYTLHTESRF